MSRRSNALISVDAKLVDERKFGRETDTVYATVRKYHVRKDDAPVVEFYEVEVFSSENNGVWSEVLYGDEQLRVFLTGLRAASSACGKVSTLTEQLQAV
jgi:hypothetical protein